MLRQDTVDGEAKKMKDLCDKVDNMSMSTMHSDKDSRRNSDLEEPEPSTVMMKRWESHLHSTIPSLDQFDIQKDSPLVTQIEVNEETVNQHAPEFSQCSYLRLRSIEEVFALRNYLDPACNPEFQTYLQANKITNYSKFSTGRAYGISKIMELHEKKGYRLETLFAAQNIFDRYLSLVGHWEFTD
jgi:hypothetical protein